MSEWLIAHGFNYKLSTEKAYSTDANILGATHEAKDLEKLEISMHIVHPIMGIKFWDPDVKILPETVTVEFLEGIPITINGNKFGSVVEMIMEANAI